jgi:hypothetical protein
MAYFNQIKQAKITIPAASVATLNSSPYLLVAGQAGKVMHPISVVFDNRALSGYSGDVLYVGTEANPFVENFFSTSPMIFGADVWKVVYTSGFEKDLNSGDGISLACDSNPGAGTGDMIVYLVYEEITL